MKTTTIMTSLIFGAATLSQIPQAHADIIRCVFTEPFLAVQYSTTTRILSSKGPDGEKSQSNVSFQIKAAGRFDLYSSSNRTLATLQLNYRGADGMSDKIYPYSVRLSAPTLYPQVLIGGCQSNFLAARNPGQPDAPLISEAFKTLE